MRLLRDSSLKSASAGHAAREAKNDAGVYRYGFNGKENDSEVKGEGNQQDYGLRIYDPRVGKFLSVDPLANKYPYYSTYHFAGNSPIKYIDMDGGEPMGNYKDWIITNGQESGVFMATDKTGAAFWVYPEAYIKQNGFLGSYVAHRYYFFDPVADHTSVEGWSKEPFLDEGKPNSLQSGLYGLSDHGDKLILGGLAAPFLVQGGVTALPRLGTYLWQGVQWTARNYGKDLAIETFKEFAANRGNVAQMDVFDILTSTIASKYKFGLFGQLSIEAVNATTDISLGSGLNTVFLNGKNSKSFTTAGIDMIFGSLKVGTNGTSKEFGGSERSEALSDIAWDQLRYRLSQEVNED